MEKVRANCINKPISHNKARNEYVLSCMSYKSYDCTTQKYSVDQTKRLTLIVLKKSSKADADEMTATRGTKPIFIFVGIFIGLANIIWNVSE